MEEASSAFKIFTGKYTRKRSLGLRPKLEDNVRMDLREMHVTTRN